jgi:hypothetical protein
MSGCTTMANSETPHALIMNDTSTSAIQIPLPEPGERSSNGALRRFHRRLAILTMEMKVPIFPAAIRGTYEIYPRGASRMRCAPAQVCFGPGIAPRPDDSETDLLARVWQAVHTLRGGDAQGRESTPVQLTIHPQRFS